MKEIKRFIWLLLLSPILMAILVQGQPNAIMDEVEMRQDHLCFKITRGRFDSIVLKSFTFYKRIRTNRDDLIIFESDRKYIVPSSNISVRGIPVPDSYYPWDAMELQGARAKLDKSSMIGEKSIEGVYYLSWGDTDRIISWNPQLEIRGQYFHKWRGSWPRQVVAAIIITPTYLFKANIGHETDPHIYFGEDNHFPNFAIITSQNTAYDKTSGYFMNRDLYNKTYNIVIYDIDVSGNSIKLFLHRDTSNEGLRKSSKYFYLHKTSDSNQVKLVHPKHITSQSQNDYRLQLLRSVPRGFRHKGDVYLFDLDLRCVYVLHNLTKSLNEAYQKNPPQDLFFRRTNIPWEKFFNCRGHVTFDYVSAKLLPDRCDTNTNSDANSGMLVKNNPEMEKREYYEMDLLWIILLSVGAIVLMCSCVAFVYYCVASKHAGMLRNAIFGNDEANLRKYSPQKKIFITPTKKGYNSPGGSVGSKKVRSATPPKYGHATSKQIGVRSSSPNSSSPLSRTVSPVTTNTAGGGVVRPRANVQSSNITDREEEKSGSATFSIRTDANNSVQANEQKRE